MTFPIKLDVLYAYTCTHYSDQSVSMPVDSTSEGTDGVNPTTCIENNSGNRNTLHSTGSSHTSIRQPSHISELLIQIIYILILEAQLLLLMNLRIILIYQQIEEY